MHFYGLIIGLALIIGLNYFFKHQKIIPQNKINAFVLPFILSMFIGARLYHVIDQWPYYSNNLSQIPATWNGGLGIYGALIGGGLYLFFYSLVSRIPFLSLLDSITPILPLCQAIGRFGNFINHEIPIWWLEASLNLILFFLIKSTYLKHYSSTSLYLIGYGLIRFFIEFFRSDTWTIGNFKIAQIISLLFIFFGLIILKSTKKSNNLLK